MCNPRTGNVTVLRSGLAFPNGMAVTLLLRHWLHAPTAGETEVLAELPRYPDNVHPDRGDQGWVLGGLEPKKAVGIERYHGELHEGRQGCRHRRCQEWQGGRGAAGFSDSTVSEVVEGNGLLWIGSVDTPYVRLFKFASL
ncbi:protein STRICTOSIDINE SYNTHASE-LIKE 10-like [Aegilops tauschii subsp. strangulata]|uniref:protein STRICTOSIDINE SYNTHASE-LIKE 10-like n=1 Tax=Aegilops tauschii subsp. strangulata TaxID=200361 RepID=UPI003CC898C4